MVKKFSLNELRQQLNIMNPKKMKDILYFKLKSKI